MIVYRLKINKEYLGCDSVQTTKCKFRSLMTLDRAEMYKEMIPNSTIETTEINLDKKCITGTIEFKDISDNYSLCQKNSAIIHETTKYVYTVQLYENNTPKLQTVQKHKKSDINTRDLHTGKGYKLD